MGGAAGARDEDLEAARLGRARVLEQEVRRAVRGDDPDLMAHSETLQRLGRMAHRLPVRPGTHDDADERGHQPSITIPPSTGITCPVTIFESSDASQTAVPQRSSGSRAG